MKTHSAILLAFIMLVAACEEDNVEEQTQTCSCSLNVQTTNGFDSTYLPTTDTIPAGENATVWRGHSVQLVAPSSGNSVAYMWTPSTGLSCSICPNPLATPDFTTTYELTVTDTGGNINTYTSLIFVLGDTLFPNLFYIPNIFTPNGDGVNDQFYVYGNGIQEFHIVVKDGSTTVFEATTFVYGWDGTFNGSLFTDCKDFDYIVDITFSSGTTRHVEGVVTLWPYDGINSTCPANFPDCRFGNQFDGNGFNAGLNSGESPC